MAERLRFLLMYDIRQPRRLRRVHEVAVDYGERLQYSVYICDLTRQELVKLRARLREELNLLEDSVSIFDLGPTSGRTATRVEHLGPTAPVIRGELDDPTTIGDPRELRWRRGCGECSQ
jgi:CRISPR-associated protein Cas2